MIKTHYGEMFRGERITLDKNVALYVGCTFVGCSIVATPDQDGYGVAGCTFNECTFEGATAKQVASNGRLKA